MSAPSASPSSPPRRARSSAHLPSHLSQHVPPPVPKHFLSPTFSAASHALSLIDESPASLQATLSTLRTLRDHISSSLHATAPPWPALTPAIAALHRALHATQSATPLRASLNALKHHPQRDDYPPRMAAAVHRASQLSANVALAAAVRDFAHLLSAASVALPRPPPEHAAHDARPHHHEQRVPHIAHFPTRPPPPLPDRFLARATALHRARQAATSPPLSAVPVLDEARANLARHHAALQAALEACLVGAVYAPTGATPPYPSSGAAHPRSPPPPSAAPSASVATPELDASDAAAHDADQPPSPPASPPRPPPPVAPDVFPALVAALDLLGGAAHAASVLRAAAPSALVALVRDALTASCDAASQASPPPSPPPPPPPPPLSAPGSLADAAASHSAGDATTFGYTRLQPSTPTGTAPPPPAAQHAATAAPQAPAHAFDPHLPPASRAACARVLERVRLSMTAVLRRLSSMLDAVPDEAHAMAPAVRAIWRDMAAALSSFVHVLLAFPAPHAGAPPSENGAVGRLTRRTGRRGARQERGFGDGRDGSSLDGSSLNSDDLDDHATALDDDAYAGMAAAPSSASAAPASISLLPSMAATPQPPALAAPHTSFAAPWRASPPATEPFAALVHAVPLLTPSIYNLEVAHGPLQQFIMSSSRMRDSWRERGAPGSPGATSDAGRDAPGADARLRADADADADAGALADDECADNALPQLLAHAVDLFERAVRRDVAKFMRAALGNRAGALLQPISLDDRAARAGPLGKLADSGSIGGMDVVPTTPSSLTHHHHHHHHHSRHHPCAHHHAGSQSGQLQALLAPAELPPLPQTALLIDVIASCLALAAAVPSVAARIGDVIDQHVVAPFCERAAYALDLVAGWSDSGWLLDATLSSIADDVGPSASPKPARASRARGLAAEPSVARRYAEAAARSAHAAAPPSAPPPSTRQRSNGSKRPSGRALRRLRAEPAASTRCLALLCEQRRGDTAACALLSESEWNAVVRLVSNARAVISELEGCIGFGSPPAPSVSGSISVSASVPGPDTSIGADSLAAGLPASLSRGRLGDLAAAAAAASDRAARLSLRQTLRERGVSARVHGAVAEAVGRTQPGCHALRDAVIERGVALLHCEVVLHSFSSVVSTLCCDRRARPVSGSAAPSASAGAPRAPANGASLPRTGTAPQTLPAAPPPQHGSPSTDRAAADGNGLSRPSSIFKALPIRLSGVDRGAAHAAHGGSGSPVELDEFGDPISAQCDAGRDPELEEYGFPNSLLLEQKDWAESATSAARHAVPRPRSVGASAVAPALAPGDSPGRGDTGDRRASAGAPDTPSDAGSDPCDSGDAAAAAALAMGVAQPSGANRQAGGARAQSGGSDSRAVEGGRAFGAQMRGMDACARANLGARERDFVVAQADVGVGLGIRTSGDVCGRGDRDVATGARLFMDAAATVAADSLGWPVVESDYSVAEGVSHSASECRTLLFAAGML